MEDSEIISLYEERNETAITQTGSKYGHYLHTIGMNILHSVEDTEECVNDTYLSAWNQIPPQHPKHLLPFLGRIMRCLSLNRFDYRKAQKRNSEFDVLLSELEECIPSRFSVENSIEGKELSASISSFLRELSPDMRNIFIRRYWFSDSIEDICARFHMSQSKVKSILHRTRKRLKNHLEKEGYII